MADKQSHNNQNSSDEIDLGQLFQMMGKGFDRVFRSFLRLFLYLKKNVLILIGLVVLGVAIGFGLNQIVTRGMKTDVIVKPNLESKNYLYSVIDEIQSNIKAQDTSFFRSLGISLDRLKGFKVEIEPVEVKQGGKNLEDQMKYLETLQNFENTAIISDVVRTEILNNSSLNHRISFFYKDAVYGQKCAKKLMDYINSNPYFKELIHIYHENANERIKKNEAVIKQLDNLISNYSEKIGKNDNPIGEGKIFLDNEESLDMKGLFELKNNLIRDNERKRLELKEQTSTVSIINFGRPQQVQKAFFGKNIVLLPTLLVCLFFIYSVIKYLNKKASEIEVLNTERSQ
ncbi:hypothetical protein [Ulvibacterium marinum]|uniref:Uncharacterized protein n=1 Tax=Ulvibacterium marinum TaxID=2419782 RepID=A0A3B0CA79_9FLAO|nr:hypothetical protein [Ulvibacterium marinum]RKN82782.1 hypothetical protein D7Z94_02770 [Ulvibacterium marinum]